MKLSIYFLYYIFEMSSDKRKGSSLNPNVISLFGQSNELKIK